MGKCQADGGKRWKSTVGEKPDGTIKINPEVNGVFNGKHENSNKDLHGKCLEATARDRSHKIDFTVSDNKHRYLGVFINDERIEGFRINTSNDDVSDRPLNGDEDWVAVKVGT